MSVEQLVDLVAEALTCPGYAFHIHSAGELEEVTPRTFETDTWLDIENNVARYEQVEQGIGEAGLGEDEERRITAISQAVSTFSNSEGIYPNEENRNLAASGPEASCLGLGREALSTVISCRGRLWEYETAIERDVSFRGWAAIALTVTADSSDANGTPEPTRWFYFDEETLLPLGSVSEGTDSEATFETDFTYEAMFVPLESLPSDFFDPASIGYLGTFPFAPLDSVEIPVYWLGSMFEGSDEYAALALDQAVALVDRALTPEGPVADITYRPARHMGGLPWVRLGLYTAEAWEIREQRTTATPLICEDNVELDVGGHRAMIRRRHHGPAQGPLDDCLPPDSFSAVMFFDDVVVHIQAPNIGSGTGFVRSPYDSEAAMELLIRSLELRE